MYRSSSSKGNFIRDQRKNILAWLFYPLKLCKASRFFFYLFRIIIFIIWKLKFGTFWLFFSPHETWERSLNCGAKVVEIIRSMYSKVYLHASCCTIAILFSSYLFTFPRLFYFFYLQSNFGDCQPRLPRTLPTVTFMSARNHARTVIISLCVPCHAK